jgi:ubiquitin-protein ligase
LIIYLLIDIGLKYNNSMSKLFAYTDVKDISSNLKTHARVLKEITELNNEFHSLRTVMQPDPEDYINLFYFTMVPNDGAMAHQPLVGRMIIPKTYPDDPPIIHLFTITGRFNVDVYRSRITQPETLGSSMCFDVLRSKSNGGIWEPNFTISCLFASLMQAIVSYMVPQQYGNEVAEFVSMEKLATVYKNVKEAFEQYKHLVPAMPEIKLIDAIPVKANMLKLPYSIESRGDNKDLIISSDPFYLQTNDEKNNVTFGVDLSFLHSGIVFSIILSNSKTDPTGSNNSTILVRNGVTATAAKKREGENIRWFYHGKPMNQDKLRMIVTVANNQFTMTYLENKRVIVHGDCPVSFLGKPELGNVEGIPFYINILLKKKSGFKAKVNIFKPESGYLHPGSVALPKPEIIFTGSKNYVD